MTLTQLHQNGYGILVTMDIPVERCMRIVKTETWVTPPTASSIKEHSNDLEERNPSNEPNSSDDRS